MHRQVQHFDQIIEHAASLAHWSQHYDKLTPGAFHGVLQDMQLNGVRLFRETLSSAVAQHTHTPAHCINLLLPVNLPSQPDVAPNRSILADGLNFLPYDGDFFFVTPPGTDYIVISLDCQVLEHLLVAEDVELFYRRPRGYGMKLSARRLQGAQVAMTSLLEPLEINDQAFHNVVLATLLDVLEPQNPVRIQGLGGSHQHIVKHCHERVLQSPAGESLSILDLCRELKIPRRTLHYSFEKIVGISPLSYLRAIRLNAAQRSLAEHPAPSVADVAYRWGFTHQSYFSQEYKRLFGHSPSAQRRG
ncbi:HTH-type transcriptional activator RhaS [compost metagenome]